MPARSRAKLPDYQATNRSAYGVLLETLAKFEHIVRREVFHPAPDRQSFAEFARDVRPVLAMYRCAAAMRDAESAFATVLDRSDRVGPGPRHDHVATRPFFLMRNAHLDVHEALLKPLKSR